MSEKTTSNVLNLDFNKISSISLNGTLVVPTVVQEVDTKEVLILGYVNQEALDYALKNRRVTFWSTSRNALWVKGESSNNILELIEVRVNCEQNSLLYLARLRGSGACHVKKGLNFFHYSCYYRALDQDGGLTFI